MRFLVIISLIMLTVFSAQTGLLVTNMPDHRDQGINPDMQYYRPNDMQGELYVRPPDGIGRHRHADEVRD